KKDIYQHELVGPGLLGCVKNVNRSGNAFAAGTFAGADAFADGLDKAGLDATAGLGCARAEWSVFDAEVKGPNASVGAGASLSPVSAKPFARAELASASASAGPVKAKLGLAVDTGLGISPSGVEVLGTGLSVGSGKISVSLFGSGFEVSFW
uniref:Uncharacterized protein n=1 Tax=Haplochromis burtoni TaxID=8153 RepID=A0A3Q2WN45_HAPBU